MPTSVIEQHRHDIADLGASAPRNGKASKPRFDLNGPDITQKVFAPFWNDPSFQLDIVDVLGRVASPSVRETQFALFKMTAKLGDGHQSKQISILSFVH